MVNKELICNLINERGPRQPSNNSIGNCEYCLPLQH